MTEDVLRIFIISLDTKLVLLSDLVTKCLVVPYFMLILYYAEAATGGVL